MAFSLEPLGFYWGLRNRDSKVLWYFPEMSLSRLPKKGKEEGSDFLKYPAVKISPLCLCVYVFSVCVRARVCMYGAGSLGVRASDR